MKRAPIRVGPAFHLYFLYFTLYKTDRTLRRAFSDGPKVSVFETVDSSLLTQAYGYAGSDANWYSQYFFVCFLAGSGLIIILLSTTIAIFVLSILILLVFCGWIHKKTGL